VSTQAGEVICVLACENFHKIVIHRILLIVKKQSII